MKTRIYAAPAGKRLTLKALRYRIKFFTYHFKLFLATTTHYLKLENTHTCIFVEFVNRYLTILMFDHILLTVI